MRERESERENTEIFLFNSKHLLELFPRIGINYILLQLFM